MKKLRAESGKVKKHRTKSGRVTLCKMVFKAKDWRGEDREVRLRGEKDHLPGHRQTVWPPNFFL